ncbi:hypothetical protein NFI96_002395 [Prochilodus magdalenae]|nr:hypothetical protein NFI96_002395 [Prochilodus magdalenae]
MLEEPASAPLATADQLSTEFAKQRSSLKEDLFSLIQEAVKPLQVSTEPLQATVTAFQTRLTSVESVAGDNFERLTAAESTVELLRVQNQSLLDRLEDLENRSPRCNLRIWNIPEGSERGKDPLKFMAELLMQMLGPDVFPAPPELERAHRSPSSRTSQNNSPRPFLVCFSKFQHKEAIIRWARNHELKHQGATVRIYQDFSTALTKKRAAFNGIEPALYQKNLRFHLLYPARLRMFLGDDIHVFSSHDEAQRFLDQRSCK